MNTQVFLGENVRLVGFNITVSVNGICWKEEVYTNQEMYIFIMMHAKI